jgi:hypothetical protein
MLDPFDASFASARLLTCRQGSPLGPQPRSGADACPEIPFGPGVNHPADCLPLWGSLLTVPAGQSVANRSQTNKRPAHHRAFLPAGAPLTLWLPLPVAPTAPSSGPEWIRTTDPCVISTVLSPSELQAHCPLTPEE